MKKYLLLLVAVIAIGFTVTSCSSKSVIEAGVAAENLKCPQNLGNGMTLVKVEFSGLYVTYDIKYEYLYLISPESIPTVKSTVIQTLRQQSQFDDSSKDLLDAMKKEGIGIIYHYYNDSGSPIDIVIESSDL